MDPLLDLTYEYKGKKLPDEKTLDSQGSPVFPYIVPEELRKAVNLAIGLHRPLLIKGEPGCGKTRLAQAVAFDLGLHLDYYEPWYIKSTSRARDGLYTYDAIGRLRDAQLAVHGDLYPDEVKRSKNQGGYVQPGPLGRAFTKDKRCVVLIDEIDKADIDFPNDLLLELDELRYKIEETNEIVKAKHPPIVFITSNDEKDLPDAFLRRCIFFFIEFPKEDQLKEIIHQRFPASPEELVKRVIERFLMLREKMAENNAVKKVSTSELLDWFRVLRHYYDQDPDGVLQSLASGLLYPGVLIKNWEDYQTYTTLLKASPVQPSVEPAANPPVTNQ